MRLAYVDPPYLGYAEKFYGHLHPEAAVYDSIDAHRLKRGLTGAKPEAFCRWVMDLLGWRPGDEVDDVFPGTGVFGRVADRAVLELDFTQEALS